MKNEVSAINEDFHPTNSPNEETVTEVIVDTLHSFNHESIIMAVSLFETLVVVHVLLVRKSQHVSSEEKEEGFTYTKS